MSDEVFPVHHKGSSHYGDLGLQKRELFAAMAMQGFIMAQIQPSNADQRPSERRAELAVKHADALIAALAEKKP